MKTIYTLLIIGILLGPLSQLLVACSEEDDCSLNTRPLLKCDIYTLNEITNVAQKDTLESLTITALGTDSIILNNQKGVKDILLPLRYAADSTQVVFHYSKPKKLTDTLTIRHSNTPYFLSMDCGYQMKQAVTSITYSRHVLDSIHIANPEAGIYGTENILLFY